MKNTFALLCVLTGVIISGTAQADTHGPHAKEFYARIESFRKACVTTCQAPFQMKKVFDVTRPGSSKISTQVSAELGKAAFDQAQIWGDTILEGDYISEGDTRLDEVMALYENNKLLGYRITYSERAWYTGDCNYDPNNEASKYSCTEGRIREASFVSVDFKTFFRDEDAFADFVD